MFRNRGWTDRAYMINFIAVSCIGISDIILTALSGVLNITDMGAMSTLVQYAYVELGVFSGFIVWKAQRENVRKFNANNKNGDKE